MENGMAGHWLTVPNETAKGTSMSSSTEAGGSFSCGQANNCGNVVGEW